ncbi:hypothetical protein EHS25_004825 [Saitozyma podzolica]|uniref:Uncharacterized protein n=1 Tax=Saitozyma podzolica TaxID=1890683 RepID=A0A427Y2X7_9TREE|nr:hypothetical protein EHS25_004825 [Saitozyma podzolica]
MSSVSTPRPLPMHTAAMPRPEAPALGLGLDLNPNPDVDEDADGSSDPDKGNPSLARFPALHCSSSFLGFGMGSTITIPSTNATLNPFFPELNPEYDLYTALMEDKMMSSFSHQGVPGNSADVDGSYDYPFTPVTSTIPLPLPALGPQFSSEVNTAHDETAMATTTQPCGDLSFATASPPCSALNSADPMLSSQADHLVTIRDKVVRQHYPSGAGDWLAVQHHTLTPPF